MIRYLLILMTALLCSSSALLAGQDTPPLVPALQPPQTVAPGTATASSSADELFDIKGPIEIPAANTTIYLIIASILALIMLIVVVLLLRKRTKKHKAIMAHETALLKLQPAQQLIEEHKVEDFVTLVDQTLRDYIEQRFTLSAKRQTTREFITTLTDNEEILPEILTQNSSHLTNLRTLFDLVKFARADMTTSSMQKSLSELISFIESTRMEAQ